MRVPGSIGLALLLDFGSKPSQDARNSCANICDLRLAFCTQPCFLLLEAGAVVRRLVPDPRSAVCIDVGPSGVVVWQRHSRQEQPVAATSRANMPATQPSTSTRAEASRPSCSSSPQARLQLGFIAKSLPLCPYDRHHRTAWDGTSASSIIVTLPTTPSDHGWRTAALAMCPPGPLLSM